MATRSEDFQRTPKVVAVITSAAETLTDLLSHYTEGPSAPTSVASTPTRGEVPPETEGGDTTSPDADAAPGEMDGKGVNS